MRSLIRQVAPLVAYLRGELVFNEENYYILCCTIIYLDVTPRTQWYLSSYENIYNHEMISTISCIFGGGIWEKYDEIYCCTMRYPMLR